MSHPDSMRAADLEQAADTLRARLDPKHQDESAFPTAYVLQAVSHLLEEMARAGQENVPEHVWLAAAEIAGHVRRHDANDRG